MTAPWPMHVIQASKPGMWNGADGVSLLDVDGDRDLDVASGWESSGRVTVSLNPGPVLAVGPWPTVTMPRGIGAVEDAVFADVDADGHADVIAASESKKVVVYFAPNDPARLLTESAWTIVEITAAANVQRWSAAAFADMNGDGTRDLVIGGRQAGSAEVASVGYFTSSTPRIGSSWVYHRISEIGWTMSMVPLDVDRDGDLDLVLTDRSFIDRDPGKPVVKDSKLVGTRWSENLGGGNEWASHMIHARPDAPAQRAGDPKFAYVDANRIIDCTSDAARNKTTFRTSANWDTWTFTDIPQPSGVSACQDVLPADLDGDGREDLVITYSTSYGTRSGVVWLRYGAAGWERGEISGELGIKYDNVLATDLDFDGDLDLVTSEQNYPGDGPGLGVIWYENPRT